MVGVVKNHKILESHCTTTETVPGLRGALFRCPAHGSYKPRDQWKRFKQDFKDVTSLGKTVNTWGEGTGAKQKEIY